MNKNIFLFLMIISFPAFAQEEDTTNMRDPRAREKIRAAHAAYITERLELTSSEAEKFWPVYREYAEKRRNVRQELREARRKGADEKTLLDLDLKIKQEELDLEKEYSQRLQNLISPEKVLKLRQAEGDFRKLLFRQIQHRRRIK
jgi:CRISPR/Cas system-associated endonuclease Cas1